MTGTRLLMVEEMYNEQHSGRAAAKGVLAPSCRAPENQLGARRRRGFYRITTKHQENLLFYPPCSKKICADLRLPQVGENLKKNERFGTTCDCRKSSPNFHRWGAEPSAAAPQNKGPVVPTR